MNLSGLTTSYIRQTDRHGTMNDFVVGGPRVNYKNIYVGSGAEPQPTNDLMHSSLKIWHLVATILIIFSHMAKPR